MNDMNLKEMKVEELEANDKNDLSAGGGWLEDWVSDLVCGCKDINWGKSLPITAYDSKW